jgi:hypothetical protein
MEPISAADLKAKLESDPEWVEATEQAEQERRALRAALTAGQEPLVEDLARVGVLVHSVWDLLSSRIAPYPQAVPVLLDHLTRPYLDHVGEGIALALKVDEARPEWAQMAAAYRAMNPDVQGHTMEGLADTLQHLARKPQGKDIVDLVRDTSRGESRAILLRAVMRLRLADRWTLITDCQADPDLRREAEHLLQQKARRDTKRESSPT